MIRRAENAQMKSAEISAHLHTRQSRQRYGFFAKTLEYMTSNSCPIALKECDK
jgi:hypothetical protein